MYISASLLVVYSDVAGIFLKGKGRQINPVFSQLQFMLTMFVCLHGCASMQHQGLFSWSPCVFKYI